MRFALIILSCVLSYNSFAGTVLKLEADGFMREAMMTRNEEEGFAGTVTMGDCMGTFMYEPMISMVMINFEGSCSSENMEVDMSKENFNMLLSGSAVMTSFRCAKYFMRDMKGTVSIVMPVN